MEKVKRFINCITGVFVGVLLAACAGVGNPANPPSPSATNTPSAAIIESPKVTPVPSDGAEETAEPAFAGDLPAFLQAGLPTRDKMTDIERWYYYGDDITGEIDQINDPYNIYFENETKADLDGDGKDETISILPGKSYTGMDNAYSSVKVSIDGHTMLLKAPDGLYFFLSASILDINKNDGKKELMLEASSDDSSRGYLITYDSGKLKNIFNQTLSANGTGYCINQAEDWPLKDYDHVSYFELLKMRDDRSGFDVANTMYCPSYETYIPNNASCAPAPTMWDDYLAKTPGGREDVFVPKGTGIYFGLYDRRGWFQIIDVDGNSVGWLNEKRVNHEDYTNDYFADGD